MSLHFAETKEGLAPRGEQIRSAAYREKLAGKSYSVRMKKLCTIDSGF